MQFTPQWQHHLHNHNKKLLWILLVSSSICKIATVFIILKKIMMFKIMILFRIEPWEKIRYSPSLLFQDAEEKILILKNIVLYIKWIPLICLWNLKNSYNHHYQHSIKISLPYLSWLNCLLNQFKIKMKQKNKYKNCN